ncbi:hypothetical protein E3N88_10847 [Mikania micrantha]|uniref:Uncharacterized protein n=1 Tax=Mikania micrantha TaxID=192012 RepID=A0A5N6PEN7_9ASTR|nr:hypothetical protein E3N88_10847 [Mikania micrantha]
MASGFNRGGGYYGAAPYRSRWLEFETTCFSHELMKPTSPVASEIESEAKFQNEFINQLKELEAEVTGRNGEAGGNSRKKEKKQQR